MAIYEIIGEGLTDERNSPVPPGNYRLVVSDVELKGFNTGDGAYLNIRYEICEGPHTGRRVFDMIPVKDNTGANEGWLNWAKQCKVRLEALFRIKGIRKLEYTYELEDTIVTARLAIEKDKTGMYDDKNKVVRILGGADVPLGGQAAAAPQPMAPSNQPPPPPAGQPQGVYQRPVEGQPQMPPAQPAQPTQQAQPLQPLQPLGGNGAANPDTPF